jgi:glucan biosynthesis protein
LRRLAVLLRETLHNSLVMMTPTLPARSAVLPIRVHLACVVTALALFVSGAVSAQGFDFDSVDKMARALAGKPYSRNTAPLPKALKELTYDQTRDIRFNPARAWRADKLPFELQFSISAASSSTQSDP